MVAMRSTDIRDEVGAELEPAPIAVGPDGMHLRDNARAIPPPPRLCEAGPCRHYHRFVSQLDAERPMGATVEPGGRVTGDGGPQPFYTEVHHYCYPDVGIETILGAMPVLECNRWDPVEREEPSARAREVAVQYMRELDEWKAARAAEESPAVPTITNIVVTFYGHEYPVTVDGDETLRQVREFVACADPPNRSSLENGVVTPIPQPRTESLVFFDSAGNEITNLDATLHQLGIADGEQLTLTLPAGHGG